MPASVLADDRRLELDLGQLRNVADVTLNGKPLGILWKPPYACDVTGLVRNGKNELKIEIINLWANRLVGDANLPREKRVTAHYSESVRRRSSRIRTLRPGAVTLLRRHEMRIDTTGEMRTRRDGGEVAERSQELLASGRPHSSWASALARAGVLSEQH